MVRRIIIAVSIMYCMVVSFAFAGTFSDDFEDGDLAGWNIEGEGNWKNWKVENGELLTSNQSFTLFSTGEAGWSDYTVQADVMIVKC